MTHIFSGDRVTITKLGYGNERYDDTYYDSSSNSRGYEGNG